MKAIKEPKGPVIEIINPRRGGTIMTRRTMRDLIKLAEMNNAVRLLLVFER
jgi:hypothetical protein